MALHRTVMFRPVTSIAGSHIANLAACDMSISRSEYTDRFVDPALARSRLYFPDAYKSLEGTDLQKRKAFERRQRPNSTQ
jgi:hypothetical protein